jgi:Zn finger protein HypA/HybF involved in hydrogenase expression
MKTFFCLDCANVFGSEMQEPECVCPNCHSIDTVVIDDEALIEDGHYEGSFKHDPEDYDD